MQVSLVLAWCNSCLLQFSVRKWSFCVMSDVSRDLGASAETDKVGPDYFAFYTHEVAQLLLQDEDFLPFSSQNSELAGRAYGVVGEKLFCNGIGARLSDFKKERLKAVLQQSVLALSKEVDEMLDPVLAIRRLQSSLKYKKSLSNYSAAACEGDAEHHPHKKIKLSSSSSSISIPLHASPISGSVGAEDSGTEGKDVHFPEKGLSNGIKKSCAHCHATESSKLITGPEGLESLCNACVESKQGKEPPSMKDQIKESCLVSNIEADNEYREVNDDLLFLLENDAEVVEESMKKHSDELSTTLGHMEQQIEELLDTVLSNCRLMTLSEKQQLRKLIQKLPPRNLDRVVEIIRRNKPPGKYSSGEVHVDLEKEDNVTLWRLYYYVEAVENARKLPG